MAKWVGSTRSDNVQKEATATVKSPKADPVQTKREDKVTAIPSSFSIDKAALLAYLQS